MFSLLPSSVVDRGFESLSGRPKIMNLVSQRFFSDKYATLRSKSKDWFAPKQNNISEWRDMSTFILLFQRVSTMKTTKRVGLVESGDLNGLIEI